MRRPTSDEKHVFFVAHKYLQTPTHAYALIIINYFVYEHFEANGFVTCETHTHAHILTCICLAVQRHLSYVHLVGDLKSKQVARNAV